MYTFQLHITKTLSTLSLLKAGEEVALRSWTESRDMGRQLFEAMNGLLKEYNLQPEMVEDLVVASELPEIYTSARIAETVKRVYTWGVKIKKIVPPTMLIQHSGKE